MGLRRVAEVARAGCAEGLGDGIAEPGLLPGPGHLLGCPSIEILAKRKKVNVKTVPQAQLGRPRKRPLPLGQPKLLQGNVRRPRPPRGLAARHAAPIRQGIKITSQQSSIASAGQVWPLPVVPLVSPYVDVVSVIACIVDAMAPGVVGAAKVNCGVLPESRILHEVHIIDDDGSGALKDQIGERHAGIAERQDNHGLPVSRRHACDRPIVNPPDLLLCRRPEEADDVSPLALPNAVLQHAAGGPAEVRLVRRCGPRLPVELGLASATAGITLHQANRAVGHGGIPVPGLGVGVVPRDEGVGEDPQGAASRRPAANDHGRVRISTHPANLPPLRHDLELRLQDGVRSGWAECKG
mmetsp:Transcript_3115/g.10011  ORF Transcript_3115/g.10011 Transcript_3115/m.10011 type:complete len:353 (+) Transcript_3115:235-1293(+)